MKNYITINQKGFSNFKDIDLVDATIFRYIFDFAMSNNTQKLLINNELYFWVSYQKIIDDNPLLGISNKRVIERRIKKLLDNELLKKYIDKENGNKVYFNITQLAYDVIIDNKEYVPNGSKVCTEQDIGVCTEQDNNRELYNRELIEKEKKEKNKFNTKDFIKLINYYLDIAKKLNKNSNINRMTLETRLRNLITQNKNMTCKRIAELIRDIYSFGNSYHKSILFKINSFCNGFDGLEVELKGLKEKNTKNNEIKLI